MLRVLRHVTGLSKGFYLHRTTSVREGSESAITMFERFNIVHLLHCASGRLYKANDPELPDTGKQADTPS